MVGTRVGALAVLKGSRKEPSMAEKSVDFSVAW